MGVGVSLVLIAIGAILRFATTASVNGFNIQTIGLILILIGVLGFIVSLFFWSSWGGVGAWGGGGYSRRRTVVRHDGTYADPDVGAAGPYGAVGRGRVVTRVEEDEVV